MTTAYPFSVAPGAFELGLSSSTNEEPQFPVLTNNCGFEFDVTKGRGESMNFPAPPTFEPVFAPSPWDECTGLLPSDDIFDFRSLFAPTRVEDSEGSMSPQRPPSEDMCPQTPPLAREEVDYPAFGLMGVAAPPFSTLPSCLKSCSDHKSCDTKHDHMRHEPPVLLHDSRPTQRVYSCPFKGCDKRYTDQSSLSKHKKSHSGERPFICTHPGCGRTFVLSTHLTRHALIHTGEKPHVCPAPGCGRRFLRLDDVKKHVLVHTGERPYTCNEPSCSKSFARVSALRRHQRTVHRGQCSDTETTSSKCSSGDGEYLATHFH